MTNGNELAKHLGSNAEGYPHDLIKSILFFNKNNKLVYPPDKTIYTA